MALNRGLPLFCNKCDQVIYLKKKSREKNIPEMYNGAKPNQQKNSWTEEGH